jgi:hypothetical protein
MLTKPSAQVWWNFCSALLSAVCIFFSRLLLLLHLSQCFFLFVFYFFRHNSQMHQHLTWHGWQNTTVCEFNFLISHKFLLEATHLWLLMLHVFLLAGEVHDIPICSCFKVEQMLDIFSYCLTVVLHMISVFVLWRLIPVWHNCTTFCGAPKELRLFLNWMFFCEITCQLEGIPHLFMGILTVRIISSCVSWLDKICVCECVCTRGFVCMCVRKNWSTLF